MENINIFNFFSTLSLINGITIYLIGMAISAIIGTIYFDTAKYNQNNILTNAILGTMCSLVWPVLMIIFLCAGIVGIISFLIMYIIQLFQHKQK